MREFNEMAIFVEVAARGTLSAAARRLGIATSVVSERMTALEHRLGVRLIARTTRQLALTDAGHTYLTHCRQILEHMAAAEQAVLDHRDEPRGTLRVTAPTPLGRRRIAPLVGSFVAAHPEIHVQLVLEDRLADLLADGFDVAVRGGQIADSTLVAHLLGTSRRVVVASPAYLERCGTPEKLEDLAHHACLIHSDDASPRAAWCFGTGAASRLIRLEGRLSSNNSELPIAWARAGLGVAQKSWWEVAQALRTGELVTVLNAFEPDPVPFVALHHGRSSSSRKIGLFVAHLMAGFAQTPLDTPL